MVPVLLAALVLVDAAFFILLLKPAEQRARQRREQFSRLENDLRSQRSLVGRLRDVVSQLDEGRQQDRQFHQEKFLPRATGFSTIMEQLDRLAVANKVRKGAVSYSLNELRGQEDLFAVDISTALEGDYTNVVQFMNQVERSSLFLLIDQITVAGSAAGPTQPRSVRLTLRLVTFFRA